MRLHIIAISVVFAVGACAIQPPATVARSSPTSIVRVATWNVHDLFDAVDRLAPPGELDGLPSADEVDAKLERVAGVLARIDADLVLLQEVENLPLAEALAARAGYPEARLVEAFDPRGIDVAVLSRAPIGRYVSHLGETGPDGRPLWSRDCVEAHAAAQGGALVLVGTHLVSKITDPGGDRREAQAARMREIADAVSASDPDALVLVGGDLNDEPGSHSLGPLLGDGEWVDPLEQVGLGVAWTWSGASGGARLDYLLLPRNQAWRAVSAAVVEGADVAAASDHRPVVVDLLMGR